MSLGEVEKALRKLGLVHTQFAIYSTVKELNPIEWNNLAREAAPMMEWEYFYILDESQCVSPARGFFPFYIGLYDHYDQLIALAPMFERSHGAFEFGISGLMNDIAAISGVPVGKGLVGTIPFTPVPAYQFLIADRTKDVLIWDLMLKYLDFLCETRGFYSVRFYFLAPCSPIFHNLLVSSGYVGLVSNHFLWTNCYRTFEQFLNMLTPHRRRNIRREIRKIEEMDIEITMHPGSEVASDLYERAFMLYQSTWRKHMPSGINPYLNETFFSLLRPFFQHRCFFSVAKRYDTLFGLALFYGKDDALFGRYWGCTEDVPFLHFATCYYKPMMYAIEKGIHSIDPGFGGEHKALRGFDQIPVYHYIKFYGHHKAKCYAAMEQAVENCE